MYKWDLGLDLRIDQREWRIDFDGTYFFGRTVAQLLRHTDIEGC